MNKEHRELQKVLLDAQLFLASLNNKYAISYINLWLKKLLNKEIE